MSGIFSRTEMAEITENVLCQTRKMSTQARAGRAVFYQENAVLIVQNPSDLQMCI